MFSARDLTRDIPDQRGREVSLARARIIASGLLLIVAAVFLWRNNLSAAFVIAALGACAWFLSYRTQLRSTTAVDDDESDEEPSEYQDEN